MAEAISPDSLQGGTEDLVLPEQAQFDLHEKHAPYPYGWIDSF
jgi:hypothetical protein